MSRTCGSWDGSSALASTMLELVDCEMRNAVEQSYGLLAGPGSPFGTALTIVLTIYVAVLGFQLIFGRTRLTIAELAPRLLAIGVVLALATNWPTYQRLVYDVLTNGPSEAARWVSGSGDAQSLLRSIDERANELVNVSEAWTKARQTMRADAARAANAPGPDAQGANPPANAPADLAAQPVDGRLAAPIAAEGPTGPRLLTWSAILLLVISAGPLLATKIVLGILLALGPIFILLALFPFTRGLATGWLRASAFLAIVPLLSALSTAGALLLLGPVIDRIVTDAAEDRFSTVQALGLFAGTLVLAGSTLLLLRVSHMIASGWSLEFRRPAEAATQGVAAASGQPGQPGLGSMPRADQIAYAIERAAAATPAQPGPAAPTAMRFEMPLSSAAAGDTGAAPGRRMGMGGSSGPVRSNVRPLRANEAR
jgi:type IV secretion system protein VirB6